jgi:thiamine biosynthesis lipoprotein
MRALLAITLLMLSVQGYGQDRHLVSVKRNMTLMGAVFEITVVAQDEEIGYINIEEAASEIKRIERLISSWDPESETSRINQNAGIQPVRVSEELYNLIERCVQISEITNGAFDISYATLDAIWAFDGSLSYAPTESEIRKTLLKMGYRQIVLDPGAHSVFLKKKGMKIGFGAIGKGYAADKVKALLTSRMVPAGMINAGGDITTWGTKATGEKWMIGVANPVGNGSIVTWLPLVESSVAISGNHRKFITIGGNKYTDILDPRNGYPITGVSRVSVFGRTAEFCDAMSTAIFVLGKDEGLALVNQLGGIEAVIEDAGGAMYESQGILLEMH